MGDVLQFVDRISDFLTVRLDLNDDITWGATYGCDFSPPRLKTAWSSSLLVDGERPSAAAYENRRIKLSLELKTTTVDGVAAELQKLARELNRPVNLLKWQPTGMTKAVYFRVLRSAETSVQDFPGAGQFRTVDVVLTAEPFAYGPKENLPSVTVSNDPSTPGSDMNANPYFETDANNWTPFGGTFVRSTAQFHQGAASGLLTPDGVSATTQLRSEMVTASAGTLYQISAWVRCAVARSVVIKFRYNNGALPESGLAWSIPANTWTLISHSAVPPAGTTNLQLAFDMTGTPPASNTLFVDEAWVRQDAAGNGLYFDVTGVKGDVETPLIIKRPVTNVGSESLFAVRRRGTPANTPFLAHAEFLTQGTNTTVQPNDAAFSGAGSNYSRCTFGTAAWSTRLSAEPYPAQAATDSRGTYRVFARLRRNGTTSTLKVRIKAEGVTLVDPSGADIEKTITGTAVQMVDLGLVNIPGTQDPVYDGPSQLEMVVRGPSIEVQAERSGAGTDTLDFDYLLFVPADDRLAIVHWPISISPGDRLVVDAMSDMTYAIFDFTNEVMSGVPGYHVGGLPMVSPGQTNRIFFINETTPATGEAVFPTTWTVDAWYWPRYLSVRPATT